MGNEIRHNLDEGFHWWWELILIFGFKYNGDNENNMTAADSMIGIDDVIVAWLVLMM